MGTKAIATPGLLTQWSSNGYDAPYYHESSEIPKEMHQKYEQETIFCTDSKRYMEALSIYSKNELSSLIQNIATFAATPFSAFAEIYKFCAGTIHASTCLKNICMIPIQRIALVVQGVLHILRAAGKAISTAAIGIGFSAWHIGERFARLLNGSPHTVLSNRADTRDTVHHSLGLTLLAGIAVFIPFAPVQIAALPIIMGSICGTINNVFAVHQCPEYHTINYRYNGPNFDGHAIKTSNCLIKPIITGCYQTTRVTRIITLFFTAVATIPYTAAPLPLSCARTIVVGVSLASLVAARISSFMAKNLIQTAFDSYCSLNKISPTEDDLKKTFDEFAKPSEQPNPQSNIHTKLLRSSSEPKVPVNQIVHRYSIRSSNVVLYFYALEASVIGIVSTIFLRIFVF